jgi:nucleoside-diphosphate-sugar epimerase
LYVEDAVGAYTLLAEQLARRRELSGMAFNFGGGAPTTVVALATKILELMEVPPELEIRNIATSEIQRQVLDINRAVTTLGWRPEVSRDQGLRHTIAWYRSMMDEKVARKDDGVDAKSRIVEERLPR